ncbi:integral membrane sensor signal transduction histidine kinase [Paenibacillus curdlanolyticus YK9]|uniref:histidine kinase n=1 Tax=Paenibacillus curdlanolyticus YK9 TaxID=717606 RepID=E0I7Q8_9BACL|nr:sensor histidine kinase [Paenibacillus curdlanolyticus]EFM11213.1 integral membrane sensor signal transduction histidine kinase [Paenibacillus curdlanolyticus YK9]
MRLFWRAQLPLMLMFMIQLVLVPLLYAVTGEGRAVSVMLYGMLISAFVLLVYLVYHYVMNRDMYTELSRSTDSADNPTESLMIPPLGTSPLPEAIHERMTYYEFQYSDQLQRQQNAMEQHITFINRWVHQMKTPLSVIQLTLPELEDAPADHIRDELDRLRKGLEMVLYTARLERFEQDFAVEALSLRDEVNKVIVERRKLFIRKGVTPEFQIDSKLTAYSDSKWFRFMLDQIVTNAVNYSGGMGKRVYLTAEETGENVVLHIRDEGIGIEPEDIGRVFNPYFTGERGRQYAESTGMGLYLVREIAHKLGHSVALQSAPGQGTTVTLTLRKAEPAGTPS